MENVLGLKKKEGKPMQPGHLRTGKLQCIKLLFLSLDKLYSPVKDTETDIQLFRHCTNIQPNIWTVSYIKWPFGNQVFGQ